MRPIVLVAAAGGAGALVGLRFAPPAAALAVTLVLMATALVLRPRPLSRAAVAVGFLLVGLAAGGQAARGAKADCRARIADGAALTVIGVLEALPWDDGTVPFRAERVAVAGEAGGCSGELRVRLPRGSVVEPGRRVRLGGRWWSMPEGSPWPRPAGRTGTMIAARVAELDGVHRPSVARARVQARLRGLLPERAGFAEALLLARKEGLGHEVRLRFAESGLAHLLAISGTHVGLLAGTLVLLAGLLRVAPRAASGFAAGVVVAYVIFLGAPWAASRAALQVLLLLGARLLQRPADRGGLLAAAGVALVAIDPLALLDAGFQLSFAGIFGLLAWREPILRRLPPLPAWLGDGLAAGTAATLATAPIAALHFGQLALVGIVANLAAIPILGAAVPALGALLVVDRISPVLGGFLAGAPDLLLRALDSVARMAVGVPGGHLYLPVAGVLALLAAAAAGILAAGLLRRTVFERRPGASRLVGVAAAVAALGVVATAAPLARTLEQGALEIHAIDVGQGDAIAIRTPRGRWLLVDAGPRTDRFDAGRRRVAPYLLRHGTARIDALIVSHPDADHIGGVPALFEMLDIGFVIEPSKPTGKVIYLESLEAARREPARWYPARAGRTVRLDDVTLEFLFPDSAALDGPGGANDLSAVFRLEYGHFRALFLGDAPAAVEEALVARHGRDMEVQLLKVGHHGSKTSTGATLLDAARPRWALIPVGRGNRYGHPHPDVMARLEARRIQVLRTDLEGSIRIRVDAAGDVRVSRTR